MIDIALLRMPADWTMLALAEHVGVELVQMPPGYPERLCEPDPARVECCAPEWLPPHSQSARLIVEVHADSPANHKAHVLARGIARVCTPDAPLFRRGGGMLFHRLVLALCERHPWSFRD